MHDDGPTLLFQRNLPIHGERCTLCPFNPAPAAYPRPIGSAPAAHPRPIGTAPAAHPLPLSLPPGVLPRPALLVAEPRGSGTLVLPDALRPAGPDAATIERPAAPGPHPPDARGDAPRLPGRAARDPDFDELASPDITVLQPVAPPSPAIRPRVRRPAVIPGRTYLALNLCLGLLIVAGLVLLATRDVPSTAPTMSASE